VVHNCLNILDGTTKEPSSTITVAKDGMTETVDNPTHAVWVVHD
jgi:uncharacterized membrane protein YgcG